MKAAQINKYGGYEVFEINNNGKAQVKAKADTKKNAKCIKEAIENCPVNAISN